jgi:hypothetical protein
MNSDAGVVECYWESTSPRQRFIDASLLQIDFELPVYHFSGKRLSFYGYVAGEAASLFYFDRQKKNDLDELEGTYPIIMFEDIGSMGNKFIRKHFSGDFCENVDAVMAHIQTSSKFYPLRNGVMRFNPVFVTNEDGRKEKICDGRELIDAYQGFLHELSPEEPEIGYAKNFRQLKEILSRMESNGNKLRLNIIPTSGCYYSRGF